MQKVVVATLQPLVMETRTINQKCKSLRCLSGLSDVVSFAIVIFFNELSDAPLQSDSQER